MKRSESTDLYKPNSHGLQFYVHVGSDSLYLEPDFDPHVTLRTIEFPLLNFPYCRLMDNAFHLAGMSSVEILLRRAQRDDPPHKTCYWCRTQTRFDLELLYGPREDVVRVSTFHAKYLAVRTETQAVRVKYSSA